MATRITSVRAWLVDHTDFVVNPEDLTRYLRGDYSGLLREPYLAHGYTPEMAENTSQTLNDIMADWDDPRNDWFHGMPRHVMAGDFIELTIVSDRLVNHEMAKHVQVRTYAVNAVYETNDNEFRYKFELVQQKEWVAQGNFA